MLTRPTFSISFQNKRKLFNCLRRHIFLFFRLFTIGLKVFVSKCFNFDILQYKYLECQVVFYFYQIYHIILICEQIAHSSTMAL